MKRTICTRWVNISCVAMLACFTQALALTGPTVSSLRPQASIVASPNPVNPTSLVNFDISGSTHQDPAKFLVSWKLIFDITGGVDWSSPDRQGSFPVAGPIVLAAGYPEKGFDYDVAATVQVTDNVGETDEDVVTVHVTSAWVPPIADPDGPYFGRVGMSVTLDGSGSHSPNPGGSIVAYDWDLDGNGTYETYAGSLPTLAHTWNTPYSGSIGLKVTDNYGLTSTASVYTKIVVSDLRPVAYPLVTYRRISLKAWEYTYRFTIRNYGMDTTAVSAELQNYPAQVTVIDGNVSFGDVSAGATVSSSDTFTIRIDRSVPVRNSDLTWRLTFTDAVGDTWVLVNFPLY